jgi:hypothetical protein
MSDSNLKEPVSYTTTDLNAMRVNARTTLSTRKLNTDLNNIKIQILGANNTSPYKNIVYSYIFDQQNIANDYFIDLLKQVQNMFPSCIIKFIVNYNTERTYDAADHVTFNTSDTSDNYIAPTETTYINNIYISW